MPADVNVNPLSSLTLCVDSDALTERLGRFRSCSLHSSLKEEIPEIPVIGQSGPIRSSYEKSNFLTFPTISDFFNSVSDN